MNNNHFFSKSLPKDPTSLWRSVEVDKHKIMGASIWDQKRALEKGFASERTTLAEGLPQESSNHEEAPPPRVKLTECVVIRRREFATGTTDADLPWGKLEERWSKQKEKERKREKSKIPYLYSDHTLWQKTKVVVKTITCSFANERRERERVLISKRWIRNEG